MTNATLEEPTVTERMEMKASPRVAAGEETCPVPGVSEVEGAAPMEDANPYSAVLCCCCDLRQS